LNSVDVSLKAAAGLLWLSGVGFGVFCIPAIRSVAAGHGPAIVFGFPAYGGGPFERIGVQTTVPLLLAFLAVCALEVAAGVLVWMGQAAGAWLALALVVPGLVFWIGFALPFGPVFAVLRTVLILAAWRGLS
jgi:hypothetical protein